MSVTTYQQPRMITAHGGAWGLLTGAATLATSQTVTSNGAADVFAVLIALITALGAVAAAWVASRVRNRNSNPQRTLGDDEMVISRHEYERLRDLERRRRAR